MDDVECIENKHKEDPYEKGTACRSESSFDHIRNTAVFDDSI